MDGLSHIVAESLASDNLWSALVFLAALALTASLKALGGRVAERRRRRLRRVVRGWSSERGFR
jgi:hypothetical protein